MMHCQRVDGATRLIGLLGWPVSHSLSPVIHNHALAQNQLPYVYVPLPVEPAMFEQVVRSMPHMGFVGANVTIPHKMAAAAVCDALSPLSQLTGTVNTLVFRDGRITGTTTDAQGFLYAVNAFAPGAVTGEVVMLGNGGTARTLAYFLADKRLRQRVTLVGRNGAKVKALADEITRDTGFPVGSTVFDALADEGLMKTCTLLVNTTPVGMVPRVDETPLSSSLFTKDMAVFDAIYNPPHTRFLREAAAAGCRCANGFGMLLGQAMASFRLWTGVDIEESMFDRDELQVLAGVSG